MRPLPCVHSEHQSTHAPVWLAFKLGGGGRGAPALAAPLAVSDLRRAGTNCWYGFGT